MRFGIAGITRIDVLGVAVTLVGAGVGLWFGVARSDSAAQELDLILDRRMDMQTEHSTLQNAIQRDQGEFQQLQKQARREGNLDDQKPVQVRLRGIRNMADQHGWSDVQIMPVQWRSAADVAEQTFSITAVAGYMELLAFAAEFEASSTWADVSHLSIEPLSKQKAADLQRCKLEVTLNFYSSYDAGL